LEDTHPRQAGAVPKLVDLVGDDAEVFGQEREPPEDLARALEEVAARDLDIAAVFGGLLAHPHLPIAVERHEVVQTQRVETQEFATQAINPPAVAVTLHDVPAIKWV